MAVDYDVVVIGSGRTALLLAARAAKSKARIGLVLPSQMMARSQIAALILQMQLSSIEQKKQFIKGEIAFNTFTHQLHETSNFSEDLEALQFLGVDVILEAGEFQNRSTFVTKKRKLRSRSFVLAIDPPTQAQRQILGLNEINYLTYDRLLQLEKLPDSLAIIGDDAISCMLAQALRRLGVKISLIAESDRILPKVDVEVARLLQAKLEVEEIEIYSGCRVTAIGILDPAIATTEPYAVGANTSTNELKIWAGNFTIAAEQILLPQMSHSFHEELNLSQAGITVNQKGIAVNRKLQTRNSRIYVCHYDWQIAEVLSHILWWPGKPSEPQTKLEIDFVATEPQVASLGLTELEARLQHGKGMYVLRYETPPTETDSLGEFCKILCRHNGEILGAHILSDRAAELLSTIAVAKHNKLKIPQLAAVADSLPSIIAKTAQQYAAQLQQPRWLESWFDRRRELNW